MCVMSLGCSIVKAKTDFYSMFSIYCFRLLPCLFQEELGDPNENALRHWSANIAVRNLSINFKNSRVIDTGSSRIRKTLESWHTASTDLLLKNYIHILIYIFFSRFKIFFL